MHSQLLDLNTGDWCLSALAIYRAAVALTTASSDHKHSSKHTCACALQQANCCLTMPNRKQDRRTPRACACEPSSLALHRLQQTRLFTAQGSCTTPFLCAHNRQMHTIPSGMPSISTHAYRNLQHLPTHRHMIVRTLEKLPHTRSITKCDRLLHPLHALQQDATYPPPPPAFCARMHTRTLFVRLTARSSQACCILHRLHVALPTSA